MSATTEFGRFSRFVMEHLADATYWIEENGSIRYANEAASLMTGYTVAELCAMTMYEINVDLDQENWPAIWALLKASGSRTFEARHRRRDGRLLEVEVGAHFFHLDDNEYSCAFIRDIGERKELESRLRQAEKMEAIGRLAGGVAHDFNNQLTGIVGYAELLRRAVSGNDQAITLVDQLFQVAKVAADLTAQLLAFSRQGKFLTEPVDVHRLVNEVVTMLTRSIDKRIAIEQTLRAERSWTLGDPSQLQSAVLNLVLNARDAMPDGGRLSLITSNVDFKEAPVPLGLAPGAYLALEVHDTGVGMDPAVQARVFEPFFTTKDSGAGTGLGLAAVYGTAKNHKGGVSVESRPGEGSSFTLYLPVSRRGKLSRVQEGGEPASMRLHGQVVVIDDEAAVRDVVTRMLEALGCSVAAFADGTSAVEYVREHPQAVDLVLLDLVMPGMSGADTFDALRTIDPEVQVLIASGYSLDGLAQTMIDAGAKAFLQKPFSMVALAGTLRRLLAR